LARRHLSTGSHDVKKPRHVAAAGFLHLIFN
jgi:hypothetical protein